MSEPDGKEVYQLFTHLNGVKDKIKKHEKFMDAFDTHGTSDDLDELENRLEALIPCLEQYYDFYMQLSTHYLEDENTTQQLKTNWDNVEEKYFYLIGRFKKAVKSYRVEVKSEPDESHTKTQSKVKLPEFQLPKFDGAFENWIGFRDTFEALIDKANLRPIEKLLYLVNACKEGEADQVIGSINIAGENYPVAWQALKNRYEDKKLLVDRHISELLKCKAVAKENPGDLRHLLSCYSNRISQIQQIVDDKAKLWDLLLIHLASWRLDDESRREWEKSVKKDEIPSWKTMEEFLNERCRVTDKLSTNSRIVRNKNNIGVVSNKPQIKTQNHTTKTTTILLATNAEATPSSNGEVRSKEGDDVLLRNDASQRTNSLRCHFCGADHFIYHCDSLIGLPCGERRNQLANRGICLNCLNFGHTEATCRSAKRCQRCKAKHHTIIHESQDSVASEQKSGSYFAKSDPESNRDLLATAIISVSDVSGEFHSCRVLLDTGAEGGFISERLATLLGLKRERVSMEIGCLNQQSTSSSCRVTTIIQSRFGSYSDIAELQILPMITYDVPSETVRIDKETIPVDIELADPQFFKPGKIDIILSSNYLFEILLEGKRELIPGQVSLRETKLGWIAHGTVYPQNKKKINCMMSRNSDICGQIERFWKVETLDTAVTLSEEEKFCEENFQSTTKRDGEGRFVVRLPLRSNVNDLQDNRKTAIRRLHQMETRLEKNPELQKMYREFMDEYIQLDHMVEVKTQLTSPETIIHYMPHHSILKMSSTTTKLRVVFNAACKGTNQLSLNDVLCIGPPVQRKLFSIFLRFCQHPIAFIADTKMMYRQILIDSGQVDMQRVVWRSNPNEAIKDYALQTVTYGTSPASFLATRCLKQLAIENRKMYPKAARVIEEDFYMDDLETGCNTVEEALQLQDQIIKIMSSAGFHLRKWMSNSPQVLEKVDPSDREFVDFQSEDGFVKTLGQIWRPQTDKLSYSVVLEVTEAPITKRKIASAIAKWYDPLGKINPVILVGKILMQKLWALKIDWDEELPDSIQGSWLQFYQSFDLLGTIEIDRCVLIEDAADIELHGFADASQSAYGAAVYVRSVNSHSQVKVQLLCAKSRVAPLQQQTLPKLELMAAALLAELVTVVRESLDLPIKKDVLYSDSTIVLSWLRMESSRVQSVFVRNRVSKIQMLTKDAEWRHIDSENNPADHVSRGLYPSQILHNELWWNGPRFLQQPEVQYPKNPLELRSDEIPEVKVMLAKNDFKPPDILETCSSIWKLKRIFSHVVRFICNITSKTENRRTGDRTFGERGAGLYTAILMIQRDHFKLEVKALENNEEIPGSSPLKALNVFLDTDGLLRVGGRLRNADLLPAHKNPVVLPNNHPFTYNLVRYIHYKNLHCSQNALLAFVRQEYWPLRAKDIIRKVIHTCVKCFRFRPKPLTQFMGDLPSCRVNISSPFHGTGLDYGGPFNVRMGGPRSRTTIKCWISVFVCMATKAIHLELVTGCTTEAFLAAFDRFIGRRGTPADVYSDNATTYVGASNEIAEIVKLLQSEEFQHKLQGDSEYSEINWHFIPARAPNFGGLWEAAIKSVKTAMIKVIGERLLNYEEMTTILCQIERMLNSRPITQMSDDPNDLEALTPGHFLVMKPLNARPQENFINTPSNRLSRWHSVQKISQDIWRRWQTDYLHQLQQRTKWFNPKVDIKPGVLVIVKEDNVAPYKWKLARIIETHPGLDNVVRAVTVKTSNSSYKRPISKICLLPIEDSTQQPPEHVSEDTN